jgi:hypothetical protein
LLDDAPADRVSLGWIVGRLEGRSFGLLMLVMAVIGLSPGIASVSGFLLAVPAFQMMLGRKSPAMPRALAARLVPTAQIARWIARMVPAMRYMETLVRPRWGAMFRGKGRFIGLVELLLAVAITVPVPFAYLIPTAAIILISFAYVEEDGLLLCVALFAAALSLAFSVVQVWAGVRAIVALVALWF